MRVFNKIYFVERCSQIGYIVFCAYFRVWCYRSFSKCITHYDALRRKAESVTVDAVGVIDANIFLY